MRRTYPLTGMVALALVLGCDAHDPIDNLAPPQMYGSGLAAIVDGNRGGNEYFRFVAPIANGGGLPAPNDNRISPEMDICRVTAGECSTVVWAFTRAMKQPLNRTLQPGNSFNAEWATALSNLDADAMYRIRVMLDRRVIGYADVDVVNSSNELSSVDTEDYIGVVKGSKVRLGFWIRSGIYTHVLRRTGAQVGGAGGLVKLDIPKDATDDVHIGVVPMLPPSTNGAIIVPNTYYQFSPENLSFSKPVGLTIKVNPKWIPGTIRPDEVRMLRYSNGGWSEVPGSDAQLNKNFVRAVVTGLGGYALGKLTAEATDPPHHLSADAMPASVMVNTPTVVEVVARDVHGNPANASVSVSAVANGPGGATPLGTAATVNGRATFTLDLAQPGYNNTITFTADGLASHTTNAFTVAQLPSVPTGLGIVNELQTGLDLSYSVGAIFGTNPRRVVSWAAAGQDGSTTFVLPAEYAGGPFSDHISNLQPNTRYSLNARVCIDEGCSENSENVEGFTLPGAMQNLRMRAITHTSLEVESDAAVAGGEVPNTYRFYIGSDAASGTLACDAASSICAVPGLTPSTQYVITGEVCNPAGCGPRSEPVTVATAPQPQPPATPGMLTANAITTSSMSVAIPNVAFTGTSPRFEVRYGASPGGPMQTVELPMTDATQSTVTTVLNGLTAGTLYDVSARACDAHGCSAFSSSLMVPTLQPAPQNLRASTLLPTSGVFEWDAQTNPNGVTHSFQVYLQQGAGAPQLVNTTASTTTSHTLSPNTGYVVEVRACNVSGCSPSQLAVTTPPLPLPPGAPTRLQIASQAYTGIGLAWLDNSTNEEGFRIMRATAPSLSTFVQVGAVNAGTTTFMDTFELVQGMTVLYRVDAFNLGGVTSSNLVSTIVPTGQTQPMATFGTPLLQTGTAGSPSPNPARVRLVNAVGNPVFNVPVTFTVTSPIGSFGALSPRVTTAVANTNSSGIATAPAWIVESGTNTVVVSATGYNTVTFTVQVN